MVDMITWNKWKSVTSTLSTDLPVLPVSEVWNMGYSAPWILLDKLIIIYDCLLNAIFFKLFYRYQLLTLKLINIISYEVAILDRNTKIIECITWFCTHLCIFSTKIKSCLVCSHKLVNSVSHTCMKATNLN